MKLSTTKLICFLSLLLFCCTIYAQNNIWSSGRQHKGHFFLYWGYNWDAYSKSNIHFEGQDYKFTLKHVKARDKQEKFTFKNYFAPKNISIPQYNYRLGYWITNDWAVSIGLDHMKYVVTQNQTVPIEGYINTVGNHTYNTTYSNGDEVKLTKNFLQMEHTDGLNYLSVEVDKIFKTFPLVKEKVEVSVLGNLGLGVYIPRTEIHLLGIGLDNKFHLAGWGASAMAGVHFEFWRILFLRAGFKTGYAGLFDILVDGSAQSDRVKQRFAFYQIFGVIGANFRLFKLKSK